MTKQKRLINALIFLVGLVVFAVYYFEDEGDMNEVEQKQDKDAVQAADTMLNALNSSFDDIEFDEGSTIANDSIVKDSM